MNTLLDQQARQMIAKNQHQNLIDKAAYSRTLRKLSNDSYVPEDRPTVKLALKHKLAFAASIALIVAFWLSQLIAHAGAGGGGGGPYLVY
jgi:hypothetical protein